MEQISKLFAVEAEKLLASGLTSQAIELCQAGVGLYPDYPAGYIMLARALESKGDFDSAASVLEDAISLFPANRLVSNFRRQLLASASSRQKASDLSDIEQHAPAVIQIMEAPPREAPLPEVSAPLDIESQVSETAVPVEPAITEDVLEEPDLAGISDNLDITTPKPEIENIVPVEPAITEEDILEEPDLAGISDNLVITAPEPEIEISVPEEQAITEDVLEEPDLADISDILDITTPAPEIENITSEEPPLTKESILEGMPLADIADILDIEQPETEMESIILEEPAVTGEAIFETSPLLEITGLADVESTETETIAPEEPGVYQIDEEIEEESDLSDFSDMLDIEQPLSEPDAVAALESGTEETLGTHTGTGFLAGSMEGIDPGLLDYAESNAYKAPEVKLKKKFKPSDYYRRESDLISEDQFLEFNPVIEVGSFNEIDELWQVVDSEYPLSATVSNVVPEDMEDEILPEINDIYQPNIDLPDISGLVDEETAIDDIYQPDTSVSEIPEPAQDAPPFETTSVALDEEEFVEEYFNEEPAQPQKPAPKLIFRSAHNPGAEYFTANDIKAANLNLIPGLHYSPLKVRAKRFVNINHLKPLPEPPAFTEFAKKEQKQPETPRPKEETFSYNPPRNLSLKDLADQIKNFGSQAPEETEESRSSQESEEPRVLVSETMAKIYFMQGAFVEAAEAYRALAEHYPDKRDSFLEKAEEAEKKASL